ncbi:MAG: hypothetical protein EVJ47_00680 [Candidatus Acidulodesulfobacterium ferriphilum]|uniref:PSP proline-rich domain-containing protein n=1 Tax=Candidatus Acidulodesulfobacterium ferriphilum TaxID=2597223 RepID=A0A519BE30_9DELT|nr:MAG: hypothetical protein EVJ47_00680 [Candidatus Acidulodesulfobacterium ferriphilum]
MWIYRMRRAGKPPTKSSKP